MPKVVLASLLLGVAAACGGPGAHPKVEEAPIDTNIKRPTDLPPDEVGGSNTATTTSSSGLPEHGPPPGVGPQPLDVGGDAGASASGGDGGVPSSFIGHAGGLTEKECSDLVMKLAKMVTKETKAAAPSAADLPHDAVYGPMFVDCGKSTTKKQQKCAAATRTSAAWKKCME